MKPNELKEILEKFGEEAKLKLPCIEHCERISLADAIKIVEQSVEGVVPIGNFPCLPIPDGYYDDLEPTFDDTQLKEAVKKCCPWGWNGEV